MFLRDRWRKVDQILRVDCGRLQAYTDGGSERWSRYDREGPMDKLAGVSGLVVVQRKEWGEILTGFETMNGDPQGRM